jgi:cullin-4
MNYMQEMEVADYLLHVSKRLEEEGERVLHYLEATTRRPLISVVEQQLLAAHIDAIITKGLDKLLDTNRREDLARCYSLFSRVSALPRLKAAFNTYIKARGTEIVMDAERDKVMVQQLLDLKARLDAVLRESFHSNPEFAYALKDAFEASINARRTRPAELLAEFIDAKLRSGNKGTSEEELETVLERVMTLFRYLNGKDVFEAFYKKHLAKRLLLGKSASADAEKSMISKLKTECGSAFTSKLEGMFKDIDLSRDIMASFRQSAKHMTQLGKEIDMNVFVLTTGYWPAYAPVDIKLPQQLANYQEVFRSFYTSKYSGRRLLWQTSLGHCVLKSQLPSGRKELQVSLFQTVVLLLFNDADSFTYREIAEATGLEEKELKRTLQSLACGRVRPLVKQPQGKEVADSDVFHWNKDLKHKLYRIKINSIQLKETEEENKKTKEGVFQDRQYQIDAAVVRIMKTRKTLSHSLLMSELYQQLKFPLKPADVKKRIESLIDREYLERDANNPAIYNYLA